MRVTRGIARGLAKSGVPTLLRGARTLRRSSKRAFILMYHRVAPEPSFLGLCVPPALFTSQLEMFGRRVRVLPLAEVVERLRVSEPLAEDLGVITFDDGYRDNLDVAFPILERLGMPATVFVTTGFIDGLHRPAEDRAKDALERIWASRLSPDRWTDTVAAVDALVRRAIGRSGSWPSVRALDAGLKQVVSADRECVLTTLERLAGGPSIRPSNMLDWSAVRKLARHGIEIASHTVSHPILSRTALADAETELRASKERLEHEIQAPVRGFAYPNGHREDFCTEHVELLRRLDYKYACVADRGANEPGDDVFRLRRIGIGTDSPALLDLKLALLGTI